MVLLIFVLTGVYAVVFWVACTINRYRHPLAYAVAVVVSIFVLCLQIEVVEGTVDRANATCKAGMLPVTLVVDGTRYDGCRSTKPACQEDEPCWNCQTMGNRICGANPQGDGQ